MSKTATILFALCTLFCSACSWVDDDQSDCPTGCWLKLSYTYNMLNVDAVTTLGLALSTYSHFTDTITQ